MELDLILPHEATYNSNVLLDILSKTIDVVGKSLEVYIPPFSAWVLIEDGIMFELGPTSPTLTLGVVEGMACTFSLSLLLLSTHLHECRHGMQGFTLG